MSAQNTLSKLMPRNDSAEQTLKANRRYNGIIQKQLIDKKETNRLKDLSSHQRRFQSSSVTPVSQPDKIPQTVLAETPNKEIGDLKKALKEEKVRCHWLKKQFTDDQQIKYTEAETRASSVIVDKNATVEALEKEKNKTRDLANALKIERRPRKVMGRTLTHERDLAGKGEGIPLARKVLAEVWEERTVLAEVDEEILNERTRSQSVAGVSLSAKKRKLNPALE